MPIVLDVEVPVINSMLTQDPDWWGQASPAELRVVAIQHDLLEPTHFVQACKALGIGRHDLD